MFNAIFPRMTARQDSPWDDQLRAVSFTPKVKTIAIARRKDCIKDCIRDANRSQCEAMENQTRFRAQLVVEINTDIAPAGRVHTFEVGVRVVIRLRFQDFDHHVHRRPFTEIQAGAADKAVCSSSESSRLHITSPVISFLARFTAW
jgi:hypothetical protein